MMKHAAIYFLMLFTLPLAGQYAIESVTDSTVALKESIIDLDSLESVAYLTGAIDSASMVESLFGFIRAKRTGEARAMRQAKEYERDAVALNAVSNAFSDSLYFDWTLANHAAQFLAAGSRPNYRIRVGANLYWAKAFVSPAGALVMEVTNANGSALNPRDVKGMLILSPESFRLLALAIIGENVDFILTRQDTRRKAWEGEK